MRRPTMLILVVAIAAVIGCRSQETVERDPLMWSRAFQEAGFKNIKASVTIGDGHILGWSYNVMGTHVTIVGDADPSAVPEARLRLFFPSESASETTE